MLKKIRIGIAAILFTCITLLFLDFSGTLHAWLGWIAKIQFLPALLALNLGVIIALVALTLLFGRVYCSVICPLGILQDIFAWFSTRKKKNRYHYTKAKTILRYAILGVFAVLMLLPVNAVALLIAPYSAFGRIAQNLLAPIWQLGNNILSWFAERADSYAFYSVDVWIRSIPTFAIALVTFIAIAILAWRGGRTWCNTICPVGTFLGLLARFSWFKPTIDQSKCINCRACEKRCKASCINIDDHTVDYSRCVACMNCISNCKKGAVKFTHPQKEIISNHTNMNKKNHVNTKDNDIIKNNNAGSPESNLQETDNNHITNTPSDSGSSEQNVAPSERVSAARRGFLLSLPTLALSSAALASDDKTTDGGMAELKPRMTPGRSTPVHPAGSISLRNFAKRCTACQLCVASCPNGVLRPSTSLLSLMQPEMHFDKGFCRPECTRCSHVCPNGAIQPVDREQKTSIQAGIAVWTLDLCLPANGKDKCGNCSRHCPNGAIIMVEKDGPDGKTVQIPSIDTERCIGCGACEFVCPVRPVSAIHVEGIEVHREV